MFNGHFTVKAFKKAISFTQRHSVSFVTDTFCLALAIFAIGIIVGVVILFILYGAMAYMQLGLPGIVSFVVGFSVIVALFVFLVTHLKNKKEIKCSVL